MIHLSKKRWTASEIGWGKKSQRKDLTSKKKMVTKENSKYACSLNKH